MKVLIVGGGGSTGKSMQLHKVLQRVRRSIRFTVHRMEMPELQHWQNR